MTRPSTRSWPSGRPRVAFVTYTHERPNAVGVFFRALRLASELRTRGWSFFVYNVGPIPDDPKVRLALEGGHIEAVGEWGSDEDDKIKQRTMREKLAGCAPDLVVFGEYPLAQTLPHFRAATMLSSPVVLLDQFYRPVDGPRPWGVDLMILYGLRSVWNQPIDRARARLVVTAPYITTVSPPDPLSIPTALRDTPRLTVLGFDDRVLREGIALIARLSEPRPMTVTVSRDVRAAEALMDDAGIAPDRRLALPLQHDAQLFGWIATSRAVIVANGFMQLMEAVALGCPAICIDRGIGMRATEIDEILRGYISVAETTEQQLARLRSWLETSPFSETDLMKLRDERDGARRAADHLEEVARSPLVKARFERLLSRWKWKRWERLESSQPRTRPA